MRPKRAFTPACLFALSTIVLVPLVAKAFPIGQEFIPPEHWSYRALVRFEALGFVDLPSSGPFSRTEIAGFVRGIRAASVSSGRTLGARDRFDLERLEQEFASDASMEDPRVRYDSPVVYFEEDPLRVETDVDLSLAPEKPLFDEKWWVFGISNVSAKLHLGEWLTYEVRYRLTFGPERDDRFHQNKPSPRERSWNGLTSLYERTYLVFRWKPIVLFWGRDYEDWGPSAGGNLLVSKTAGSLDKLGGRFALRRVRLSFFHSYLSVDEPRRTLSAHRLEFDVRDLTIGLSETALYVGRGIDPVYALPFSAFYANQYSERGDDNIVWSVDAKYRAGGGIVFFGSLLIDDFQFEERGKAPDKLGFDIGGRLELTDPLPLAVGLKYRHVNVYTYTHRDSLKYHVAGSGDPLSGDPVLGAVEGPDADVLELRAEYFARPNVTTSAFVSYGRRGQGNDYRRHEPELDPTPPFPSGVVEKTTVIGVGLLWELAGNSSAGFDVEYDTVENQTHVTGKNDESTMIRVFLTWDF